jgi:hypothetical protein
MLFPTTLVGSYPQPEWLIDRERLAKQPPARVRAKDLWRVPEPFLAQAQDDASSSRFASKRMRVWTSSPTARSAARAIPIASQLRWRVSISTTRER